MWHTLLFNRHDSAAHTSQIRRTVAKQTLAERVVYKVFGISVAPLDMDSWKEEDNSEYPFSVGSNHPKVSADEAAAARVWNADKDLSRSHHRKHNHGSDNDEDEWNSDENEEGLLHNCNQRVKRRLSTTVHAVDAKLHHGHTSSKGPRKSLSTASEKVSESMGDTLQDTMRGESIDNAASLTCSGYQMVTYSGSTVVIPDQNVDAKKVKKKGGTSMLQDIEKAHRKVSRANLHLFDDRVFLAEDREEAIKLLALNTSKNPIRKRIYPLVCGVTKIIEIQVSSIHAVFNLCMWKDPMLSFWFSMLVLCLMFVLSVFPWRLLFFLVGLLGLGPQNYFLVNSYLAKKAAKTKTKPAAQDSGREFWTRTTAEDVSQSPLLFRDNIQMKADGKRREVIVPGGDSVFRLNRFYDWPPDPATSIIKQGMEYPGAS